MSRGRRSSARGTARPLRSRAAIGAGLAGAAVLAAMAIGGRSPAPAGAPASVLLVTIDTLRADRVGAYGARTGATPTLDALAAEGVVFEEALASVPLTLPSHATLLSGLEPPAHGVHDNGTYVFPPGPPTLATLLKDRGYATGAFVGAYVLDRRFGLARGFDHYDDAIPRREQGTSVLESERPAEAVVAAAHAWVAAQPGPFLAWVHLYDPHAPYDPPAPYAAAHAGRPYDGEVAYTDAALAPLFAAARARAGDRLVIAVLADHGESLGDHGETTHGFFLYQPTLRIPFLLAGPGVSRGQRRGGLARTADLLPTVLGLLHLPAPAGISGVDLLRREPPREAYAETRYPESLGWAALRALRVGAMKYIDAPRPELYDLAADPGEMRNLAAQRPQDVERLRAATMRAAAPPAGARLAHPGAADAEVEERLRALGYVTGGRPADARGPRKDPKDALPLWRAFEQATWADARGDLPAAIAGFRGLVGQEPDNAAFRRSLASALRRAGRAGEAAAALDGLERAKSADAVAWHERAVALAAAGRDEEALRAGQAALALNALLPEAHNHLGILHARADRKDAALASFVRATELDPNNGRAWNNRANALRALGRTAEAAGAYRRAAGLAPADPDPRNGLGVLLVQDRRPRDAATLFREALALAPDHHEARLNLAVAEAQDGNVAAAVEGLRALLAARPDPETAARARALLADLGQ